MKPGLHKLTRAQYEAVDAVNHSTIKLMAQTPLHCLKQIQRPSPATDAMALGDAVHAAVFEPERFRAEYCTAPRVDRRTRAGKENYAAFEAQAGGKTILSAEEMEQCRCIFSAALASPIAATLLADGRAELCVVWQDRELGILCKSRMDWYTKFEGFGTVVDLKTCQNASPHDFQRDIARYNYHTQAAFYLDGLETLAPVHRRWLFIAVEKADPWAVAVYELSVDAVEAGRAEYRKWLRQYAACVKSGNWPGYPDKAMPISLPSWKLRSIVYEYADE